MVLFPAYRHDQVLDMYTSSFFQLYDEGARIRMGEYRLLANIASAPHMSEDSRQEFLTSLDIAANDPRDILLADGDNSGIQTLKELL